jgi:hypothetical protein
LLVAAASGVDLVGNRAGALFELAYDQGVYVFISGARVEIGLRGVVADLIERRDDCFAFRRGENAGRFESAREGLRTAYIGVDQPAVEGEAEKRSKISEGPVSNLPPQSFMPIGWRPARRAPVSASLSG